MAKNKVTGVVHGIIVCTLLKYKEGIIRYEFKSNKEQSCQRTLKISKLQACT